MTARALVILVLLLGPSRAMAHLGDEITSAQRYLKLDVAGNRARIVASLTLAPDEGARALDAADTDDDGTVSEAERDVYLEAWGEGLADELPLFIDGERRALVWGEPYMEPIGPVTRALVTIEMVAHVELGGGRETVRIEDRMVQREVYERTEVAFRVRDGARLIGTAVGEDEPTRVTIDASYDGGFLRGAPVPLVAIVETPERPSTMGWPLVLGVAALLAISIVLFVWLRRRAR